jgi:hypothetical protein
MIRISKVRSKGFQLGFVLLTKSFAQQIQIDKSFSENSRALVAHKNQTKISEFKGLGPSSLKRVRNQTRETIDNINKSYKSLNIRERQISSQILKIDSRIKLLSMFEILVRKNNFNVTHLTLIFSRLVEVEIYALKTKRFRKEERVLLSDLPLFYRLLYTLEISIERMRPETIVYLLKFIQKSDIIAVNLFPVVRSISEFLLTEKTLEIIDKESICQLYFYFVRIYLNAEKEQQSFLGEIIGKLVKVVHKFVGDESLEPYFYFKIAKHDYYLRLNSGKRLHLLHKVLTKHRKTAKPQEYFYWFMLTTLEHSDKSSVLIVVNDMINKKVFDKLKFKHNIEILALSDKIDLPNGQILKAILIKSTLKAIKTKLQYILSSLKPDKYLYMLANFLSRSKTNYQEINGDLAQICELSLFEANENHQILLYFFNNKIPATLEHIKKVCESGKLSKISPTLIISLYKEIMQRKMNIDLTNLLKKMVKVFVRNSFSSNAIQSEDEENLLLIIQANPEILETYISYLNKKIVKISFVNLQKSANGVKEEASKENSEPFSSENSEDNKIISFNHPHIPEEFFLQRVNIANSMILFQLRFINNAVSRVNQSVNGKVNELMELLIRNVKLKLFATHLNEEQVEVFKGLISSPASPKLRLLYQDIIEEIISSKDKGIDK